MRYFDNIEDLGLFLRLELLDAPRHQPLVSDDATHVIKLGLDVCVGIVAALLSKVDHMSDITVLIFGSFRLLFLLFYLIAHADYSLELGR